MWTTLTCLLSFTFLSVLASPTQSPRPLVIWHGLGDSHSSPGMVDFQDLIKEVHPGIFIHSVRIEEALDKDREAGFHGNVNAQLGLVADELSAIPELEDGFDAIGFSQGGQFLRAYVERYNSPPTYNLITFGSQHLGIADIPECGTYDFLCKSARRIVLGAVYGHWAQENLIQAQYFRDPSRYAEYLAANHFLADINNEIPGQRNATYKENLQTLENLVLIIFSEDKTVVPKESAWFGYEEITDDKSAALINDSTGQEQYPLALSSPAEKMIVPMRQQPIYIEDWIGLKELDESGRIIFGVCDGEHMQLGDCWKDYVKKYVGSLV
ncbi:alpha/beta-hydrolase [Schizophyllum commune H4-8]|uniref:alpha/beta-hydrolase n=1 Tax=Schizophyllum commune (strain H4-8 / FGSC 9210) TaxID=578458 RepID=UPI00215E4B2C|nr:alpha/beta-hydrolase [Schizophyllum commune H4-8]KAI5889769.1 alpha/beta-hydrolase [Schizophyllum commune H4-8]